MIGRNGCQYKSKNNGFNKGIGNMKWYKVQLNTSNVIVQSTKTSINTGSHPSNNPQEHGNGNYKRIQHQSNEFWKHQVVNGVNPHNLKRINLFGNTHGTYTGGYKRAYLTSHDNGNKSWGKL